MRRKIIIAALVIAALICATFAASRRDAQKAEYNEHIHGGGETHADSDL